MEKRIRGRRKSGSDSDEEVVIKKRKSENIKPIHDIKVRKIPKKKVVKMINHRMKSPQKMNGKQKSEREHKI